MPRGRVYTLASQRATSRHRRPIGRLLLSKASNDCLLFIDLISDVRGWLVVGRIGSSTRTHIRWGRHLLLCLGELIVITDVVVVSQSIRRYLVVARVTTGLWYVLLLMIQPGWDVIRRDSSDG